VVQRGRGVSSSKDGAQPEVSLKPVMSTRCLLLVLGAATTDALAVALRPAVRPPTMPTAHSWAQEVVRDSRILEDDSSTLAAELPRMELSDMQSLDFELYAMELDAIEQLGVSTETLRDDTDSWEGILERLRSPAAEDLTELALLTDAELTDSAFVRS
jgi:hypothetical protein